MIKIVSISISVDSNEHSSFFEYSLLINPKQSKELLHESSQNSDESVESYMSSDDVSDKANQSTEDKGKEITTTDKTRKLLITVPFC